MVAAVDGAATVGLEAEHVSWAAQRRYASEWFPDARLVPTTDLVETLRRTKDAGELVRMEVAAAVADAALAAVRPRLLESPTEAELALELDSTMRRLGATKPSFETIVASGPQRLSPPPPTSAAGSFAGDLVVVDFGAVVDGYCSDMTRTIAVGEMDATSARMLEVVTAAQAAGVAAVRAGVEAREVDAAAARSSPRPDGATPSPTGPATGWGWTSTRPRGWAPPALLRWRSATWSPSSPGCTSPLTAASAWRTPSSSPTRAVAR